MGGGATDGSVHDAIGANHNAFCDDFHNDDWHPDCGLDCWEDEHCGCNGLQGSGNTQSQVRTVKSGQILIPAIEIDTEVDCYTEATNTTMGHETERASCDNNFHVAGTLGTSTYHCSSGSAEEENTWEMNGDGHCEYENEWDTHCPCKVGCKALGNEAHDGDWCLEDDECGLGGEVNDAEDDIEERINH